MLRRRTAANLFRKSAVYLIVLPPSTFLRSLLVSRVPRSPRLQAEQGQQGPAVRTGLGTG
jgi:hypothetical protein